MEPSKATPQPQSERCESPGSGVYRVRGVCIETDLDGIGRLFSDGLHAGEWLDNDSGADIQQFEEAYLSDDGASGFWVADHQSGEGEPDSTAAIVAVVGMIGVQRDEEHSAVIRRLRVDPAHRERGLGRQLVEEAVGFCKKAGYLKVVLDARIRQERAIALFERFSFRLNRERVVRGEKVLDFYLDLYRERTEDGSE